MSYLSTNVSLNDYEIKEKEIKLDFNNSILYDNNNKILEEVIYTVSLSMEDNYNIKELSFLVDDKEIYKKIIKNT